MVDGVQVAFPHDHELVFERLLFRNALCPECLVLDFQQVLYSGEALASIAAISRVELVSKTATQANGQKIVVEGGNIIEKSETGAGVGTTITVTNLFLILHLLYILLL